MSLTIPKTLLSGFLAVACSLSVGARVSLDFDAARRGPVVGPLHYGIFYEEINNAGDGGLYAELVRNRTFDDGNLDGWSRVGNCTITKETSSTMNSSRGAAMKIVMNAASQGVTNEGYWGMNCVAGNSYDLTVWIQSPQGWNGDITASMVDTGGNAAGDVTISGVKATGEWTRLTATITPRTSLPDGRLRLTFSSAGTVRLGMVSLFPPTFKNRPNGCRVDLAEKLQALKPAFVRFPGGCYIEGDGSVLDNRRFEWKKTIGPIEQRPGHFNFNWGYPVTDGMGFHEFLQLSEDLGAEPLYVVNVGIGHGWFKEYTDIQEYIQEALDAIEYCNGDVTTTWGAKRAANGHPEPFNLRLVEIGNENYNFDDERSDHYAERYKAFYDAIKSRYPDITLIGNVEAWGTDNPSWRNSFPCEIVDEHYYRTPGWFESAYNKYDFYDRSRPKVYVGEYAVTSGHGERGNLRAALGEAVYMLGMERNSDIVIMNSYAPIFMNEERGGGWNPDMIRLTHSASYGTPSYWVQQLMPNNLGRQNILWKETDNIAGAGSKIALSSWATKVKYDNVTVSTPDGTVLFTDDFSSTSTGSWSSVSSSWMRTGGALVQTNGSSQGDIYAGTVSFPSSYIVEMDATKTEGAEGFIVGFNYADGSNYSWWNIGGWNNSRHGIQVCKDGAKSDYDLKNGTIETGRTYRLKLEVNGSHVKCYIDNTLIHDVTLPVLRKVYVSSTIDDDTKTMYLKIVNTGSAPQQVDINMANASISSGDVTLLTSTSDLDENSPSAPMAIAPQAGAIDSLGVNKALYTAPAFSLSILRLSLSNVNYNADGGQPATAAQLAAAREELRSTLCKLNFLHASTTLPVTTASGATVEWNLSSPGSGHLSVTPSRFSTTLNVDKPNTGSESIAAATLIATVTFPDGSRGDLEVPVTLAPSDGMHGYLYAFMNPNYEITNFALGSRESYGKKFDVLLDGAEAFDTEALAPIEHGTRDAYLNRGNRADEYFMVTTDMSNIRSGRWNNRGIDLLRSADLIHWTSTPFDFSLGKKIFSDPDAVTDVYKTDEEYSRISRVWAPQFIWYPQAFNGQGGYLVYYSVLSDNPGDNHDRMVYSLADKDFTTLTQPRIFYDPGYAVIDADILYNPYDGLFHMMIKKEGADAASTGIYDYTSPALLGEPWTEVMHMRAEDVAAVEGPTHVRRIDEDIYNLYYMRYDAEYTYKVVDLDHLGTTYSSSTRLAGTGSFQHGSIMPVTLDEYTVLDCWSNIITTIKKYEALGDNSLAPAIAAARAAIDNNRSIAALVEALPAALQTLRDAYTDEYIDITDRLTNTDFNMNNGNGWTGTSFTATASGVAEFWNKTFDTYQKLTDMPAGRYRLEVQGFYRFGYQDPSRKAHENGNERQYASYYINAASAPFMCLYDHGTLGVPDNVGQANSAFNSSGLFHNAPLFLDLDTPGELKIGFKKTSYEPGDWCCLDNIKLYWRPTEAGIDQVVSDGASNRHPNDLVDVYNTLGVKVRSRVARHSATDRLPAGLYIVDGDKINVR